MFVATVLQHRSFEPDNVHVKIGVDGGQGYLKVTLSITLKPEVDAHSSEKKRGSDHYSSTNFKKTLWGTISDFPDFYISLSTQCK